MPRWLPWLLVACVACAGDAAREADRPFTGGLARVEALEIRVAGRASPRPEVLVRGVLPDRCTRIDPPEIRRLGNNFDVRLPTRRPFGATCEAASTPFEHRVRLPVAAHESGAYLVTVNGVTTSFHVLVDPAEADLSEGLLFD